MILMPPQFQSLLSLLNTSECPDFRPGVRRGAVKYTKLTKAIVPLDPLKRTMNRTSSSYVLLVSCANTAKATGNTRFKYFFFLYTGEPRIPRSQLPRCLGSKACRIQPSARRIGLGLSTVTPGTGKTTNRGSTKERLKGLVDGWLS